MANFSIHPQDVVLLEQVIALLKPMEGLEPSPMLYAVTQAILALPRSCLDDRSVRKLQDEIQPDGLERQSSNIRRLEVLDWLLVDNRRQQTLLGYEGRT